MCAFYTQYTLALCTYAYQHIRLHYVSMLDKWWNNKEMCSNYHIMLPHVLSFLIQIKEAQIEQIRIG